MRHVDVLRAGLKEQPDSPSLHLALAGLLEKKGDYEAAISEYEYLLKQQPGSMVVINNLASLLADNRTDKASLERAKSLAASLRDSRVPQFKDTLGWIDYRLGDLKAAVPLLEAAAAGLPNDASVHYHLGMTLCGYRRSLPKHQRNLMKRSPEHRIRNSRTKSKRN